MDIDKIEAENERLHMYLMNNTGTIYVCKKCGRQDFYETIGSMGSDSGMICDCGNEDFHEYDLNEYHTDIIDMCKELRDTRATNKQLRNSLGLKENYTMYVSGELSHNRTPKYFYEWLKALKGGE